MASFVTSGDELRSFTAPARGRGDRLERTHDVDQATPAPGAALRLAAVYACVRLLVHAAVPLPLKTYRPGARRVDDTAALMARLLARPWPGATVGDLVGSTLTSLLLHGDAFVGVYAGADGQPAGLGLLHPSTVEVRLDGDDLAYVVHLAGRGPITLGARDVVHVRSPMAAPGGLRGLSPVRQLAASFGESLAISRSAVKFAELAPRPGLIVKVDPKIPMDSPRREALRAELDARYGGANQAGTSIILGGGVDSFEALKLDGASADFVAQRQFSAGEIARAFGVPAALVDLPSNGSITYSNAESRSADLLRYSLEGWLCAIERALTAHPLARGVGVRFDRRALLRPDAGQRASVYTQALHPDTGWMTRDEVRAAEDLPVDHDRPERP